jgi:hypothetical protein
MMSNEDRESQALPLIVELRILVAALVRDVDVRAYVEAAIDGVKCLRHP